MLLSVIEIVLSLIAFTGILRIETARGSVLIGFILVGNFSTAFRPGLTEVALTSDLIVAAFSIATTSCLTANAFTSDLKGDFFSAVWTSGLTAA